MTEPVASPKKEAAPAAKAPRTPKVWDTVLYTGYSATDQGLPGFIAHARGMSATVAYLGQSGAWGSQYMVPYDETGVTAGSWRWK